MSEGITIYHGSNVEVANPRIMINAYYKDFGYGFYCTNFEKQAKRWALTKKGDSFWGLVQFSYPTHQIVFCTETALETLSFEGSKRV